MDGKWRGPEVSKGRTLCGRVWAAEGNVLCVSSFFLPFLANTRLETSTKLRLVIFLRTVEECLFPSFISPLGYISCTKIR